MRHMLAAVALLAALLVGHPARSAPDWSWIEDVDEWECTWSATYSLDSTRQEVDGSTVTWRVDAGTSGTYELNRSIGPELAEGYHAWNLFAAEPTLTSGAYHASVRVTYDEGWHGGSADSTALDSFGGAALAIDLHTGTYEFAPPGASFVTREVLSNYFGTGDEVTTGTRTISPGSGVDPDDDPTSGVALPATGRVLEGTYRIAERFWATEFFSEVVTGTVHYRFTPVEGPREVRITKLEQRPKSRAAGATDFVFSKGKLVLYAEAKVTPPDRASLVQWDVPSIGESVPKVDTRRFDRKKGISMLTVTYTGLPASNDAFGAKTLRARLADGGAPLDDGEDLRVFFQRDGRDHPRIGESVPGEPNWYYYWKQGPVPRLSEFKYNSKATGAMYDPNADTFTVGRDATTPFGPLALQLSTDLDGGHATTLERDHVEGIQAVAAAVRHELTHASLYRRAKQDQVDPDGDGIVLDHEMDQATYPPWTYWDRANTYGVTVDDFFGGDSAGWVRAARRPGDRKWRRVQVRLAGDQLAESGDNEMKAIASEKSRSADPSTDWAHPGSQAPGK